MSYRVPEDVSQLSMLELFRVEAENQTALLTSRLLELERGAGTAESFEALMRAAHSLKGAARIVNLTAAARVAHALEDCFVAVQAGRLQLRQREMDLLFKGVDVLGQLGKPADGRPAAFDVAQGAEIAGLLESLANPTPHKRRLPVDTEGHPPAIGVTNGRSSELASAGAGASNPGAALSLSKPEPAERILRLTAENLNRLLALAGESLAESRWLRPFADSFEQLRKQQVHMARELKQLRRSLEQDGLPQQARSRLSDLAQHLAEAQQFLDKRLQQLDVFERRSAQLAQRLHQEVLRTRMRPFSDCVRRFPRMVRDLARALDKRVRLEIAGETTQVDRDILERLETPLAHLLRNAVDHGCEPAEERRRTAKPAECLLRLEARQSAGVFMVTVADDGAGVDLEQLRRTIIQKGLSSPDNTARLADAELLEFLFLPGFTLRDCVTEISGRGFGLDVVQNMVKSLRGTIRLNNQPGRGLRVQLQLPLTLSVLRALLVEVAGEPYAIPLGQIIRTLKLPRTRVETHHARQYFRLGELTVGLVTAHQVLDCPPPKTPLDELPVVVLGDRGGRYGMVVDRFLGERELIVQPDGPEGQRRGKRQDISPAALMEDGSPVVILDVEEMVRSLEKLLTDGRLAPAAQLSADGPANPRKRVLAVDDSLTVRELERKLLNSHGYMADAVMDGLEAWNALRAGQYDLVITDIDMPRLDGLQLTALIKKDPRLRSLPVMIVSYKDREEDRLRGLEAGADYYLPKASFHAEALLRAVLDLIGKPV
jgi:two-component system sensor histidine kinase and response regulator WspE